MNIKVYNILGEETGSLKIKDSVFNAEYNEPLIHQVVVAQLANLRQGTKSTLTRSEVRGHAKKPWKQKHTGRARHGSTKGPQWRGGGVVFAPKPRDFSKKVNSSAKVSAFISAISTKFKNKDVIVLDNITINKGKTKEFIKILDNLKIDKSVLVVDNPVNELLLQAAGNVYQAGVVNSKLLNVYDIVKYNKLILSVNAVKAIEEAFA